MAIAGRLPPNSSNVVRNVGALGLPYAMRYGSISWSETWDGEKKEVSGSVVYEALTARELEEVRAVAATFPYGLGGTLTLYGISFEIVQIGYTRNLYPYEDSNKKVETYTLTITLGDPNRDKDTADGTGSYNPNTLNRLSSLLPQTWIFNNEQLLSDGENSISILDQGYNDAEITWNNSNDDAGTNVNLVGGNPFVPKEPVVTKVIESSDRPLEPPENTVVLRDTSSNYDQTGEKKVVKETTEINGTPESEIIKMYGFDYTYEDIHAGDGILYSTSPAQFWKQISYQETRYIYRKAGSVQLQVTVTAPEGGNLKFIVHPDYEQFASVPLEGGAVTFTSNAEFLVEVVTKGWNLHRFKNEDDGRNTLDPEDPYYPLFKSIKVPFYSRTAYLLKSSRGLFGEKVDPPFRIEFQDYDQLEPRIKNRITQSSADSQGRVAILYPDPNFVEPLYVAKEATRSVSFDWRPDPEAEVDPDRTIPNTNIVAPVPRLITGQESCNEVLRTITSSDRFRELISEYSSQDPGFDNAAEKISFRVQTGRPPAPQHRIQEWEQVESTTEKVVQNIAGKVTRYYVSTSNAEKFPEGGSVSFPEETSLNGAKNALEQQLRKSSLKASQQQKSVAWFYPEIRGGDRVITAKDITNQLGAGDLEWRVTNVSHKLEFKGINTFTGALIITPGTQLTLGAERGQGVRVTKREEPVLGEGSTGDPTIDVTLTDSPNDFGAILPSLATRRNF